MIKVLAYVLRVSLVLPHVEMLSHNPDPYTGEEIRNIVKILYEKKQKEYADRICNHYLARGFPFLTDLYEENISK